MFLVTSFTMKNFEAFNWINSIIFLLVLIVTTLFLGYKIIQHIGEPKRRWIENIPNALKVLESKRLTTNQCLHLLAQSITVPKEMDAEALFLQVYFFERLKKELPTMDLSFLNRKIALTERRSKFFRKIVSETTKELTTKSN